MMSPMRAPVVLPLPMVSVPLLIVVAPDTVRLPPEMPTGAVVLIVREAMVWSPPRLVEVSFEEPVAEKTMSELAVKLPVGVPVALLDQLLAAVQESPAEPSQ